MNIFTHQGGGSIFEPKQCKYHTLLLSQQLNTRPTMAAVAVGSEFRKLNVRFLCEEEGEHLWVDPNDEVFRCKDRSLMTVAMTLNLVKVEAGNGAPEYTVEGVFRVGSTFTGLQTISFPRNIPYDTFVESYTHPYAKKGEPGFHQFKYSQWKYVQQLGGVDQLLLDLGETSTRQTIQLSLPGSWDTTAPRDSQWRLLSGDLIPIDPTKEIPPPLIEFDEDSLL